MNGISSILHKHFSKDAIRAFAIEGKQDDIIYQITHGLQKEIKRGKMIVGYELTEKGKAQIKKDNEELEQLSVTEKELTDGTFVFYKDEKEYWKKNPRYTKEEEYKRMNEDEVYAYKHLKQPTVI